MTPAVSVPRGRVLRAVLAITAILTVGSLTVQIGHALGRERLLGFTSLLDMQLEGNLPAWFSSVLLLACSATLGLISAAVRRQGDIDARGWGALALLFGAASVDEVASIHERVGSTLGDGNVFWYLLPGSLLLLAVAYLLRGFFERLPESTRRPFFFGTAVWVFGAVVLELVQAATSDGTSDPGLAQAFLNTFQDLFELLGVIVILNALARHACERRYRLVLEVADS